MGPPDAEMIMADHRRVKPTRERARHAAHAGGGIEDARPERVDPRRPAQFIDADGNAGQPYKVVETLDAMFRAGTITRQQQLAGERFRSDYELSGLAGVRSAPLDRVGGGSTEGYTAAQLDAATAVARAMHMIGRSRCDLLIVVLVCGTSLNEWSAALRTRKERMRRVFVKALDELRMHYQL